MVGHGHFVWRVAFAWKVVFVQIGNPVGYIVYCNFPCTQGHMTQALNILIENISYILISIMLCMTCHTIREMIRCSEFICEIVSRDVSHAVM